MAAKAGDRSRYNRERRKKIARRVSARALRATLATAPPQSKAVAATKSRAKKSAPPPA